MGPGTMYAKGQGVLQDYAEAVKWYRLAAAQGNAMAQANLGLRYAKGEGVPPVPFGTLISNRHVGSKTTTPATPTPHQRCTKPTTTA